MRLWVLPVLKAVLMGMFGYQVVSARTLTDLDKSLLVALLSGFLGIVAVVIGQALAGRQADKVLTAAKENQALLERIEQMTQGQTQQLDTIQEHTREKLDDECPPEN